MVSEDGIVDSNTRGWLDLGNSAEIKSAELVAGMQAVTFPSEEWDYLSTPSGRWFAQFFFNMIKNTAVANATGARNICLTRLAEDVLTQQKAPQLVVEIGALFSGRGLMLAQKYPSAQVIEIGIPQIIDAKMNRLDKYLSGKFPSNINFVKSDLRKESLHNILKGHQADLMMAEGFLPFCSPELIQEIAASVYQCLKPEGVFIADTVSSQGWKSVEGLNRMATIAFSRQMGQFKGQVEDAGIIQSLFTQAGYASVEVYTQDALARKYMPETLTANISFLVVGRKS